MQEENSMKRKGIFLALTIVPFIFMSCENPNDPDNSDQQDGPIRIGVVGPHSGSLEQYGTPTLRAANLIAEAVNGDGGVLGRQVEIVAFDDECDPALAADIARQALDAGVVGVVGHVCSGATAEALPVYKPRGIPVISPSATNPTLTTDGSSFFFRTIAPDSEITGSMIDVIIAEGGTDIYILYDSSGSFWDTAAIGRVESQIPTGTTHIGTSGINLGNASEIGTSTTTIAGSGANAVLILPDAGGGRGETVATVVNELRAAGITGPVATTNDAYEQSLITSLNDTTNMFVVGDVDLLETSEAVQLNQEHIDKYGGDGGPFFINGGAALEVLLAAIEQVGSTEASNLVSAIVSGTFITVLGELEFQNGNPSGGQTGYVTYKISDGEFVDSQQPYIAVISKGERHDFWQQVSAGASAAGSELDVLVTYNGPDSESATEEQVTMFENVLDNNPDAIALATIDTSAVMDQIEEAQRRGIPIIAFDSGVPDAPAGSVAATVATDNRGAGGVAAEKIFEEVSASLRLERTIRRTPMSWPRR